MRPGRRLSSLALVAAVCSACIDLFAELPPSADGGRLDRGAPPPPADAEPPDWSLTGDGAVVCHGQAAIPCNGCPAGTTVPFGWVCIPAGEFTMGSAPPDDPEATDHEAPAHRVMITRPFLMMATEVTQAQWIEVVGYNPSSHRPCDGMDLAAADRCPVENMTWVEAVSFANALGRGGVPCYALARCTPSDPEPGRACDEVLSVYEDVQACPGYRLPTEAEWEYAARAGTTASRPVAVGELATVAWFDSSHPRPVARLEANAWGLYDVLGNVNEWLGDTWHMDYSELGDPVSDPVPEEGGDYRVVRGGAYNTNASVVRLGWRGASSWVKPVEGPPYHKSDLGLRLVRTVSSAPGAAGE